MARITIEEAFEHSSAIAAHSILYMNSDTFMRSIIANQWSETSFHPKHRPLFNAAMETVKLGYNPNIDNITREYKSTEKLVEEVRKTTIPENTKQFIRMFKMQERQYRRWKAAQKYTQDMQYSEANDEQFTNELISELMSSSVMTLPSKLSDIQAREESNEALRDKKPWTAPVGVLNWLNNQLVGGLHGGRMIAIGAAEKQRKTSFSREIMLQTMRKYIGKKNGMPQFEIRDDVHVAFMTLENNQQTSLQDIRAMLMFEYLFYSNQLNAKIEFKHDDLPDNRKLWTAEELCKPDYLAILKDEEKNPDWFFGEEFAVIRAAFEYAVYFINQLPMWIYDMGKETGNLKSLLDLENRIRLEHMRANGKKLVVVIDYAQLVKAERFGAIFENMSAFVHSMNELAGELNISIIVLSQFSREGKINGKDDDVMRSKGGADLEQAAYDYFTTEYETQTKIDNSGNEIKTGVLTITHRRSRRSEASKEMNVVFEIHPISGAIIRVLFDGKPTKGKRTIYP